MSTVDHVLGGLTKFLNDKRAIEIKVNRPGIINVELASGEWKRVNLPETTYHYWQNVARAVSITSGHSFDERLPIVKAKLPGGHRLMLMLGPNVIDPDGSGIGVAASIRLRRRSSLTLTDFGIDADLAGYLTAAIRERRNILVAGGTGSGKTTLTDILCSYIEDEAPVYIEDTEELSAVQPIASRILISPASADTDLTYQHVLDALTRLRPDRIVLGELNVDNSILPMRTLNMGMDGFITTMHADSAADAIPAFAELLALKGYSGGSPAQAFFSRKIGVCVHCARAGDRRVITEIVEPSAHGPKIVWRAGNVATLATPD